VIRRAVPSRRGGRGRASRVGLAPTLSAALATIVLGVGCGGGAIGGDLDRALAARSVPRALDAYDRQHGRGRGDREALARVAALLLEEEGDADDPARAAAALTQLTLAGTAGRRSLAYLGDHARRPGQRARALLALVRAGDLEARAGLRSYLRDPDVDARAAAHAALRFPADATLLTQGLGAAAASVRVAACEGIAAGATLPAYLRLRLGELSRVDPSPQVRAAATRALGLGRSEAVAALRERLSDADPGVRAAAVTALVRADRRAALAALGPLLGGPPTPTAIDAARALAAPPPPRRADDEADDARDPAAEGLDAPPDPEALGRDARAFLLRALESPDAAVRSAAALAVVSLPDEPGLAEGLGRVLGDTDTGVRLYAASALVGHPRLGARAREALSALLAADGPHRLQAAVALAETGSREARRVLVAALADPDALARRVAARALAREARAPHRARSALRDPDPLVRIAAAGGILAASVR
jgi:HEAT repeat protein